MLLLDSVDIRRGSIDVRCSSLAALDPKWLSDVLNRARNTKADFWIEPLDNPDVGTTHVLAIRSEGSNDLLRSNYHHSELRSGSLIFVRVDWGKIDDRVAAFATDFGLSPAIARTVVALFHASDVRHAAAASGLSYETAREYLEAARLAVGADSLPRLITLAGMSAGAGDSDAEESDLLASRAFGLTARQTHIAALIANGLTRAQVAEQTGVSQALGKKELATVFAAMGVTSSIGLAHVMVELRLLALCLNLVGPYGRLEEPAHQKILIAADEGRTIAVSDYGPSAGKPVLVFHSSMTSRPVNRALVEALHDAGFRPIAVDRPGFGETSDAPPQCWGDAYYELAAHDVVRLCSKLDLTHVPVITRGAAQIVLALHRVSPATMTAAVVMNPDPDARSSSSHHTFLAKLKLHFVRRPRAVRLMGHWLAKSATFERVRDHLQRSAQGCPSDTNIMADDANMQDYYRSLLAFRSGSLDGFTREQVALATVGKPAAQMGAAHFAFLIGEYDSIHDPNETLRYWDELLPDARVSIVAGAGRFMSYSHATMAARVLGNMTARSTPA